MKYKVFLGKIAKPHFTNIPTKYLEEIRKILPLCIRIIMYLEITKMQYQHAKIKRHFGGFNIWLQQTGPAQRKLISQITSSSNARDTNFS